MRTTLDIDDELLARAKARAAVERTTLTRIIEQALALRLQDVGEAETPPKFELPPPIKGFGGLRPEVTDPASYKLILDIMDEDGDPE